jgi:hypothetical protein
MGLEVRLAYLASFIHFLYSFTVIHSGGGLFDDVRSRVRENLQRTRPIVERVNFNSKRNLADCETKEAEKVVKKNTPDSFS